MVSDVSTSYLKGDPMLAKALIFIAAVLTLPAIVTAQAEKPITDVKALAGTWNGWYNSPRGGQAARAQLVIKDDGSWTFHISGGANTTGNITLVDGKARYQGSVGDPGTVVLIDNKGKEALRFMRRDGTIASEFER
jgi:hypothetical protein